MQFYADGLAIGQDTPYGVHIKGPDYAELGKPLGCAGRRIDSSAELEDELREALATVKAGKTTILNVAMAR